MLSPHLCTSQELEQLCSNDYSLVTGSLFAPGWHTDQNLGTCLVQCLPDPKPIPKINRKFKPFMYCCAGSVCYLSESNSWTQCWTPTKWTFTVTIMWCRGTTRHMLCWSYHSFESSWITLFLWNNWHVQMPTCRTPPRAEPAINWPQRFPDCMKLLLQQVAFLLLDSN